MREIQLHIKTSKMHRACFDTVPITFEQKIEKIVSKTRELPRTSGLELWPTKGGGVEESWSHTHARPGPCIALEHHKNTDGPRALVGIRKSLSFCRPLFSLLKNKRGSCIMASDQMTVAEVNISLTFVLCVTRLMFLDFVLHPIPSRG